MRHVYSMVGPTETTSSLDAQARRTVEDIY